MDYDPLRGRESPHNMNYKMGKFSNDNARSRGDFYGYMENTPPNAPRANEMPGREKWIDGTRRKAQGDSRDFREVMKAPFDSAWDPMRDFRKKNDGDDDPLVGSRVRPW